jgi:hypothetical protein
VQVRTADPYTITPTRGTMSFHLDATQAVA